MSKRRVVITGWESSPRWAKLPTRCGKALCRQERHRPHHPLGHQQPIPCRFGGECTNFDVTSYAAESPSTPTKAPAQAAGPLRPVRHRRVDRRPSRMPGWISTTEDRYRCGVIIGSGIGGIETLEEQNKILIARGVSRVSPFTVPRLMVNAASGNVSIIFNINGPNTAVATACATGSNAIGDAGRFIQYDMADVDDRRRHPKRRCASWAWPASSPPGPCPPATTIRTQASRPWDKDRDGFVMGEGAGVVVLEEYEHAKQRGARIYAEMVGYGMSGDGYHITAPDEDGRGAAMAMELALKDAGINADRSSTTSTPTAPARRWAIWPKPGPSRPPSARTPKRSPSAPPRASWATSWAPAAASRRSSRPWPFTAISSPRRSIWTIPIPSAIWITSPTRPATSKVTYAMSNSFGFGGHNACLLFKKI